MSSYVPPPKPSLNGGLFTGEPFVHGAPWANIPVIPDVDFMTNMNLRSANPPPGAIFQYPGNVRPGNNFQHNTGLKPFTGKTGDLPYNFACVTCDTIKKAIEPQQSQCKCKNIAPISGNTTQQCDCENRLYVEV